MTALTSIAAQTPGAVVLEAGELVALRTLATDDVTKAVVDQMRQTSTQLEELNEVLADDVEAVRTTATYYVGHPDLPEDWLVMVAQISTSGDDFGRDLKERLLALCDMTVQSVRFV